ncbi:hypothetical protein Pint_10717 [Pistacia integerrima]|uniref:Uncharacterized protein n=1 Tax=Pistacia integerrima TaxID=434235 RepID=A0ACC0XMX0_9ROSI|nr:hypothetical protein Pint_10717 [Pistacia integerrima]
MQIIVLVCLNDLKLNDQMVVILTLFSQIAASYGPTGSPYTEAPQILDMAVCCYPPNMFHLDDHITNSWDVSNLVELDIYHHSEHFCFIGIIFFGDLLPRFCKRAGTTQATCEVHVHQRHCFLLLLAGLKLLCLLEKGFVILLTCFWTCEGKNGVVLEILAAVGIIRSHHFWLDVEHIEEAIQNVLVCLEMVVFAVFQQYAYHVAPYSGDVEAKLKMKKKE